MYLLSCFAAQQLTRDRALLGDAGAEFGSLLCPTVLRGSQRSLCPSVLPDHSCTNPCPLLGFKAGVAQFHVLAWALSNKHPSSFCWWHGEVTPPKL